MSNKKALRILLFVFFISFAVLLLLGLFFYNLQKNEITNKIYSELQAISNLKAEQIQGWYQERLDFADIVRSDQSLIDELKLVLKGDTKSKARILKLLDAISHDSNYTQTMFIDPKLQKQIFEESFPKLDDVDKELIAQAVEKRIVMISDINLSKTENIPHIDLVIPLFDTDEDNNLLIGILFIRIEPRQYLFPLLQNWEGRAKSGETLLVRRYEDSVVFLNKLHFKKNAPLSFKLSLSDTLLPASRAVLGKEGFFEGRDYTGLSVLSYLNKIKGTNWFMVNKVDVEEIYAPLRFWALITGIVVALLIIIVAVVLYVIWKHEEKEFFEAKYELESEKKLLSKHVELLIKHANDMIFMIDADRRIVDVNDRVLETYGYSKEEILTMKADDFRSPETAAATEESFRKAEQLNGIVHETIHRRKDGTVFPVEASTRFLEIDGKKFFQGIVRDISERKRSEKLLKESEEKYRELYEKAPIGYQSLDSEGRIIIVNQTWLDILGYSKEEIIGKWFGDFLTPEYVEVFRERFTLFQSLGQIYNEFEMVRKDGSQAFVAFEGRYAGEVATITIADITERKRAEETRLRSEQRLRLHMEQSPLGFLEWDENFRAVEWNNACEQIFGYTREEAIGRHAKELILPLDVHELVDGIYHSLMHQTGGQHSINLNVTKDGRSIICEWFNTTLINKDGKPIGVASVCNDITEKRNAELHLQERDRKIQRLNRVFATLSDINQLIVREHDRNVLLEKSCRISAEKGNFLLAWIGVLDKESGWIKTTSSNGLAKEYLNDIRVSINPNVPEGKDPTGTALREKRYNVCNDVETDERMLPWRDKQLSFGIRSSAALPLVVHGETFGVFTVYSDEKGFFDTEEITLLDELSKDISFALEHIEEEKRRAQAEQSLVRSEERYRTLAENAREMIFVLSLDKKIIYVNNYGAQLFSKNPQQVIGRNVNVFFRSSEFQKQEKSLRSVMESGKPLYEESKFKFGNREIWLGTSLVPLRDESGMMNSIMGISRDITQQRIAEEQVRKLSRGVEQSPAAIVITDTNGKIEYVNPKFTEATGYTFEEVIGNNPRILKSGEKSPEEYKLLWEAIKSGKEWRGEFHNKKKNGELYWEQASISPIKDVQGNITHFIAVKEDITEMKKLIEELFAAKDRAESADKLKSEFLAQMSHEIRSPINITMNFSSLLKEAIGDKLTPEMNEYFDGIQTAGRRLIRTIGLILNASEIQVGSYEPTWAKLDLMEDILEPIKTEYGATAKMLGLDFSVSCNIQEPAVFGDRYSVNQIFVNLVDNALKYTNKGGVELTVDRNARNRIEVKIKDTGIGMSEEFMSSMFEPFMQEERGYSRRFEGNGLGLSLVKKYCELNKAKISVHSEKGKGSMFTVTFENNQL